MKAHLEILELLFGRYSLRPPCRPVLQMEHTVFLRTPVFLRYQRYVNIYHKMVRHAIKTLRRSIPSTDRSHRREKANCAHEVVNEIEHNGFYMNYCPWSEAWL